MAKQKEDSLEFFRKLLTQLVRDDYGMVVIKHLAEACEYTSYHDRSVEDCISELIDRLRNEEWDYAA